MSTWARIDGQRVVAVAVTDTAPDGFVQVPDGTKVGDLYSGVPDYLLTGAEWVNRFTADEWAWLKTQRAANTATGKQLDRMMDAIRWTNSVDVSASTMDPFYTWLLNNNIPGGQSRIDELRAPR